MIKITKPKRPFSTFSFTEQLGGGGGGGGVLTCIYRDTGICHYFGYHFGGALGFLGTFLATPGFLGIIFCGKI